MRPHLLLYSTLPILVFANHHSIPLLHHRSESSTTSQKLDALSKRAARLISRNVALEPMDFGQHDWFYGSFDVGDSKNLSLSIDTASGTLYLNAGLYRPSNESINLNVSGKGGFGTWYKDGCGDGYFHYGHVYKDTISIGDVVVHNQSFGTLKTNPPKTDLPPFTRDGIIGMSIGTDFSGSASTGWFQNLCGQGQVEQCRFGMALGTAGTGQLVFGGVDESLFKGDLTPVGAPLDGGNYSAPWNANVVVNGTKTIIHKREIGLFDSGTANILVPPDDAKAIFTALGMQIEEVETGTWGNCTPSSTGNGRIVLGYYPCDAPPVVGLHILNAKESEAVGPVFNIEPEAFQLADNGGNNCTAVIVGFPNEQKSKPFWNVGNAWMQGKYTDYTAWGVLRGAAILKDKTLQSNPPKSNDAFGKAQPLRLFSILATVAIVSWFGLA